MKKSLFFAIVTLSFCLVGCAQSAREPEQSSVSEKVIETGTGLNRVSDTDDVTDDSTDSEISENGTNRLVSLDSDDYESLYNKSFTVRDEYMEMVEEYKKYADIDDNVIYMFEAFDENSYYSEIDEEHCNEAEGFVDNCLDVFFVDDTTFEEIADIAAKNGMYVGSYMSDVNMAQFMSDTFVFASIDEAEAKAGEILKNSNGKVDSAFPSYLIDLSYD